MKFFKFVFLFSIFLNFSCNDEPIDDNLINKFDASVQEIITQDEELFDILLQIATDEEQVHLSVTCIDFVYPLTIFVIDENNEFVSLNAVLDDDEFSLLLENINPNYSISISFPIEATLETGEAFSITTKEELKASIDQCLGDEIVVECNQLLQNCLFRVGYNFNFENQYLGAIFQESDGITTVTHNEDNTFGSWTALQIENRLHININLVDADEETSGFFNHDWTVDYILENSLRLRHGEKQLILNQKCNQSFDLCSSFIFEVCENEINSETSNFILDDYTPCILDILELETTSVVSFFLTPEDAQNETNPILSNEFYNNTENNQSVYVKIIDVNTMNEYLVEIILASISC